MPNSSPLPSSFDNDEDFYNESRADKLIRLVRQDPLVPLGCLLTCAALYSAGTAVRRGDSARANIMFRRRVYAQGFTLVAVVAGSYYWADDRKKRQEHSKLAEEKARKEKHDRWIQELEAREEEDRVERERMARKQREAERRRGLVSGVREEKPSSASALEESERRGVSVVSAVRDLLEGR